MADRGEVRETYHAAIQHDLVDLDGDEHLVGVVRRPTGWFRSVVDENHPDLGPPGELLSEFDDVETEFAARGICDSGAHNAAREELSFGERYSEYLVADPAARTAVEGLLERLRSGEDLWFVCFENTDHKRCHRTILRDRVERLLDGDDPDTRSDL